MRTRISSNAGLTMLETILIIVMLSIVCIVVLPTRIVCGPSSSKEHRCFMNREAINNAKILWASEQKKAGTNTPNEEDLKVYLKDKKFPICPSGGTCTIGAVNVRTRCSMHSEELELSWPDAVPTAGQANVPAGAAHGGAGLETNAPSIVPLNH